MNQWERVDWQYAQVLDIEDAMREPEMQALRATSVARYQQKMSGRFPLFFKHYTKIFIKLINGQLNKQMYLMCLKQKEKIDRGEVDFETGNREIIDAQVNRLLTKLPEELRDKIEETYDNLKKEDDDKRKREEREAEEMVNSVRQIEVVEEDDA